MKVLPAAVALLFFTAGAAYVTRAPASLSGCTYETTLMDRGTMLAASAGTAIHSLNGPVPTAKISDTVRGTWQTLGFWLGVFGAAVQGRTPQSQAPVPCGQCPPEPQGQAPTPAPAPSSPGRAAAVKAASRYWSGRNLELAVAIAGAESGWRPGALSPRNRNGSRDHGEWQINDVHRALLRSGNWRDINDNARMAHSVWLHAPHGGRNWTPWTTYKSGSYKHYLHPVSRVSAVFARPMPPLNDSITQIVAPVPCPTVSPPTDSTPVGGVRTVKDPSSGITYHIPIPGGPRGVAINFALDQLGDRYVFGAHGPDTWDCSGLVSAAWAKAGRHFTPQTDAMRRQIPTTSSPQPGDLTYHPGHTQLVLGVIGGKNLILEAPRTGLRVRIVRQWMHPTAYLDPMRLRVLTA